MKKVLVSFCHAPLVLFMFMAIMSACTTRIRYEPEKWCCQNHVDNKKGIVFVHGYGGSPKDTWKNKDTQAYWPEMICQDFRDYNVFCASYLSGLSQRHIDLKDLGRALNNQLKAMGMIGSLTTNYEEIVFIGHSLGNLVIRSALYQAPSLYRKVKIPAIVSLASPSEGSSLASIFGFFSGDKIIQGLGAAKGVSRELSDLNDAWQRMKGDTLIFCYYETQATTMFQKSLVVDRASATSICSGIEKIPVMGINHIDIAKPWDKKDTLYQSVRTNIQEAVKKMNANPNFQNIYTDDRPDQQNSGVREGIRIFAENLQQKKEEFRTAAIEANFGTFHEDLTGDEISLLLGDSKGHTRISQLELLMQKTQKKSLLPTSIPKILGKENGWNRVVLLEIIAQSGSLPENTIGEDLMNKIIGGATAVISVELQNILSSCKILKKIQ